MGSKNTSLVHDALVDRLREAIMFGSIPPGTRLAQQRLAQAFGVSRIPLREAIRTLETEGLVELEPNKGAAVAPLHIFEVEELYKVRIALETLTCLGCAARKVDIRREVEAKSKAAEKIAAERDVRRLLLMDREFHLGLAAHARNMHLKRLLANLWPHVIRGLYMLFTIRGYPSTAWWDEHIKLAEAIAAGRGEEALSVMMGHIEHGRGFLVSHLSSTSLK